MARNIKIKSLKNFVSINEKIGTAGQPTITQFAIVADYDYQHVINLAMPDHPESITNEGQLVTELGMSYVHIPVPFENPKPEHVRQFCNIMVALEGDNVFVHCIMNYRVSAFLFHYFNKVKGYSESDSKSKMFDIWEPDAVWNALLHWTAKDLGLSQNTA